MGAGAPIVTDVTAVGGATVHVSLQAIARVLAVTVAQRAALVRPPT
jgi:hypothetical protein